VTINISASWAEKPVFQHPQRLYVVRRRLRPAFHDRLARFEGRIHRSTQKEAPAKAGASLGCEIQKGASSSGCVFSVAGAVGTVSFRSSLRIENALICHAVTWTLDLFFPLPICLS
jgi:hypothetical protein